MTDDPTAARKLAVLIDADNASLGIAVGLFAKIGEASVRQIYGDFTGTRLKGWAEISPLSSCLPHQNFANTVDQNPSDIALVIDAMSILHSGRFDGFCLVSSDGDFTRLTVSIREQGIDVFGYGENRRRPATDRHAYASFKPRPDVTGQVAPVVPASQIMGDVIKATGLPAAAAATLIETALGQRDDQAGWYFLGSVGQRLIALTSDFDPRSYGCAKLITLIEKIDAFEVRRDIHPPSQSGMILGPTPWPGRVNGDLENHQFER